MTMGSFSSLCAGTNLPASTGVSVSASTMAPPIANAYVIAIGEKMTPATPVIVKSGRNATPMMSVENVIGPATSRDAWRIRSGIVPFPWGPRCRKMFSIMMTVESTTMPKSTAPSEMRFAGVSVPTMPQKATSSASGMFSAVMMAARVCPRNRNSTIETSSIPTTRFSRTVCVVSFTRLPRS